MGEWETEEMNVIEGQEMIERPFPVSAIENRIYTVRNVQVMIDRDLAELYGVENRVLRQAVRRNIEKFPDDFLFKLSEEEAKSLIIRGVSQTVILSGYNARHNSQYPPIDVQPFGKSHDRFLVIDDKVYHFGASLKDLGKSWFAVSLLKDIDANTLISNM